jgi:hypothetical protein
MALEAADMAGKERQQAAGMAEIGEAQRLLPCGVAGRAYAIHGHAMHGQQLRDEQRLEFVARLDIGQGGRGRRPAILLDLGARPVADRQAFGNFADGSPRPLVSMLGQQLPQIMPVPVVRRLGGCGRFLGHRVLHLVA